MSILSTVKKGYITIKTTAGYVKLLPRTLATLVAMSDGKSVEEKINELNSKLKKQYVQSGRATTQNVNGYFRVAPINFPQAYKTIPNVVATLLNYQTNAIDVRLGCSVKDITKTGCNVYVMDPEGNIVGQGYEITWIAAGEIN